MSATPPFAVEAFDAINAEFGWNLRRPTIQFWEGAGAYCRVSLLGSSINIGRETFYGGKTLHDLVVLAHEMLHLKYPGFGGGHGGRFEKEARAIGLIYPGVSGNQTAWHDLVPGSRFDLLCQRLIGVSASPLLSQADAYYATAPEKQSVEVHRNIAENAYVPASGPFVFVLDLSSSMAGAPARALRSELEAALRGKSNYKIVTFGGKPKVINRASSLPSGGGGNTPMPEAIDLARSLNPSRVMLISDGATSSDYDTVIAAVDRLHADQGAPVDTIYTDDQYLDVEGYAVENPYCTFMRNLCRGQGIARIAGVQDVGAAIEAAMSAPVISVPAPHRSALAQATSSGSGGLPPAARHQPAPPLPPDDWQPELPAISPGGDMFGSKGRDYTAGSIDQLEDGANAMVLFREAQAQRMARDAEDAQRNLQTVTAAGLDAVHTEMERAALQAENLELRHVQNLIGSTVTRLDGLRRSLRAQSDTSISERSQETQALERRYAAILGDFSEAVMMMTQAPAPQAAVIRGKYEPPRQVEHRPDSVSAWVKTQVVMPSQARQQAAISPYRPAFGAEARGLLAREEARRLPRGQQNISAVAPAVSGRNIMRLFQK